MCDHVFDCANDLDATWRSLVTPFRPAHGSFGRPLTAPQAHLAPWGAHGACSMSPPSPGPRLVIVIGFVSRFSACEAQESVLFLVSPALLQLSFSSNLAVRASAPRSSRSAHRACSPLTLASSHPPRRRPPFQQHTGMLPARIFALALLAIAVQGQSSSCA